VSGFHEWPSPDTLAALRRFAVRALVAVRQSCAGAGDQEGRGFRRPGKEGQEKRRPGAFAPRTGLIREARGGPGGTRHGHVRGLLGARGAAPGRRRGTTPATGRSGLSDPAAGGEPCIFLDRTLIALRAKSGLGETSRAHVRPSRPSTEISRGTLLSTRTHFNHRAKSSQRGRVPRSTCQDSRTPATRVRNTLERKSSHRFAR